MRTETKTVTYYTLAELKEAHPNGYERALDQIRTSMWDGGAWVESVADDMTYEFGKRVGDTTVERFGEGDYPGVAGVELKNWAVQARDAHVGFQGTLEPDNSPGLPWHDYLEHVILRAGRSYTEIVVVDSDDAPYLGWKGEAEPGNLDHETLLNARSAMREAVEEALSEALARGEEHAESLESEEYLLEMAEGNEWEFDEHGAWA